MNKKILTAAAVAVVVVIAGLVGVFALRGTDGTPTGTPTGASNITVLRTVTGPDGQGVTVTSISFSCTANTVTVSGKVTGTSSVPTVYAAAQNYTTASTSGSPVYAYTDATVSPDGSYTATVPLFGSPGCSTGVAVYGMAVVALDSAPQANDPKQSACVTVGQNAPPCQ